MPNPQPRLLSNPRFLAVYSAIVTAAFTFTVFFGLAHRTFTPQSVAAAEQQHVDFDQLTIHRLNIVEPDGTPRLILSNKADFPGLFVKGEEHKSHVRHTAGEIFLDDEGTENGGLVFGGYKDKDGEHSYGHLSFDQYMQDQVMVLESDTDGDDHTSGLGIFDRGTYRLTPAIMEELDRIHAMSDDASQPARKKFMAAHPDNFQRAWLGRMPDNAAILKLQDASSHTRILLRVAPDGTPTMQFLDAQGKVTHQWPEK